MSLSALHRCPLELIRQQAGPRHAIVPHVHVHDDLQLLGVPTPGGPSLFPVLDSVAKVCRHNLHVLHSEPLLCVADHNAVPTLGHVPGGAAPGAAHDQVDFGRAAFLLSGLATAGFTAPSAGGAQHALS